MIELTPAQVFLLSTLIEQEIRDIEPVAHPDNSVMDRAVCAYHAELLTIQELLNKE